MTINIFQICLSQIAVRVKHMTFNAPLHRFALKIYLGPMIGEYCIAFLTTQSWKDIYKYRILCLLTMSFITDNTYDVDEHLLFLQFVLYVFCKNLANKAA